MFLVSNRMFRYNKGDIAVCYEVSKMNFDKLFLGPNEYKDFISIAVREKYITSLHPEFDNVGNYELYSEYDLYEKEFIEKEFIAENSSRVANKSSILRVLLLFDKIDSNVMNDYDLNRLIDCGIVSGDSIINKAGFSRDKAHPEIIFEPFMSFSEKDDYSLCPHIYNCVELHDKLFVNKRKTNCSDCEYKYSFDECRDISNDCNKDCNYGHNRYTTLLDIYTSMQMGVPVYSKNIKNRKLSPMQNANIIDDVYYLFGLPALEQLNSLPIPQSFKEMLRLRSRPEIIVFREIFKTWCEELIKFDNERTVELITKDFNKASEFFKKQYYQSQKEQKTSQAIIKNLFSIVIAIPGYFFPFLSLIGLIGTVEPWKKRESAVERKENEWFLLTR